MRNLLLLLMFFGATWTCGAQTIFHGVGVAPDGQNAWVVTIDTVSIFHTTDFGSTWIEETIPSIRVFWDVYALDPMRVWTCGMSGDIWHTSDGGASWNRQNLGGPKHAARIRFLGSDYGWAAGGDLCQLNTTNGGDEWGQKFLPNTRYPNDTVEFNGVSFVTPQMGWLVAGRWPVADTFSGGQGWIVKTIDRGDSWVTQRRDTTYDFYDCWFVDEQTGWVAGGDDRNFRPVMLKTTDGGASWSQQYLPASARFLRSICFISQSEGWACGRSGTVVHTTDAGQTWELQTTGVDTTLFDIEFADSLRGMAAGNSVVLRTIDGGRNWSGCFHGVDESGGERPPAWRRLTVARSPTRGSVLFNVAGDGPFVATVFDAAGRVMRRLRGSASKTSVRLEWDGRDQQAVPAGPGLYLVQLEAGGRSAVDRFVLLR